MKVVWAPWRMTYIEDDRKQGCLFCSTVKETDDKGNLILYRSSRSFIIMNRFPYTSGHLMVSPNRHVASIDKLDEGEMMELMALLKKSIFVLKRAFKPDGFNVGMNIGRGAGAGIEDHMHFHIVPRWNGDTNFMPVLFETKVMPEYLEKTYERLISFVRGS
ncbi:MAG: HIT domain-containing protein [Syntrophobacterales bacterium]|nr:MAG: HIT domain-containing protein [Syntrophobacterales bacterium]